MTASALPPSATCPITLCCSALNRSCPNTSRRILSASSSAMLFPSFAGVPRFAHVIEHDQLAEPAARALDAPVRRGQRSRHAYCVPVEGAFPTSGTSIPSHSNSATAGMCSNAIFTPVYRPGPVDAVAERDGAGSVACAHPVDERLHLRGLVVEQLALG